MYEKYNLISYNTLTGITSLASLVQVEPKYALDYQMIVIDCLDDPDETLKRKVQYSVLCTCIRVCYNEILKRKVQYSVLYKSVL